MQQDRLKITKAQFYHNSIEANNQQVNWNCKYSKKQFQFFKINKIQHKTFIFSSKNLQVNSFKHIIHKQQHPNGKKDLAYIYFRIKRKYSN
jgi:hypothetical protein